MAPGDIKPGSSGNESSNETFDSREKNLKSYPLKCIELALDSV